MQDLVLGAKLAQPAQGFSLCASVKTKAGETTKTCRQLVAGREVGGLIVTDVRCGSSQVQQIPTDQKKVALTTRVDILPEASDATGPRHT